ncbi:hypothetical protein J6590_017518 [Homalodisca vitripennis]|nr:hypothetical protein J6590_017518 [Homalodisca vitripennis]
MIITETNRSQGLGEETDLYSPRQSFYGRIHNPAPVNAMATFWSPSFHSLESSAAHLSGKPPSALGREVVKIAIIVSGQTKTEQGRPKLPRTVSWHCATVKPVPASASEPYSAIHLTVATRRAVAIPRHKNFKAQVQDNFVRPLRDRSLVVPAEQLTNTKRRGEHCPSLRQIARKAPQTHSTAITATNRSKNGLTHFHRSRSTLKSRTRWSSLRQRIDKRHNKACDLFGGAHGVASRAAPFYRSRALLNNDRSGCRYLLPIRSHNRPLIRRCLFSLIRWRLSEGNVQLFVLLEHIRLNNSQWVPDRAGWLLDLPVLTARSYWNVTESLT